MNFSQSLADVADDPLIGLMLPLFVVAIILEWGWSVRKHRQLYAGRDFLVSMSMLLISAVIDIVPKALAFLLFVELHEWSPLKDLVGRQWWAWVALFFLDDFIYYWFHRANHEVRLFWAGHVPHHSSERLNFGTALRQGVGERVHKYLFWLPLPLLGFDAVMVFTMIGLSLFYQFWVHTQAVRRLPAWVELMFNTPSHHRVHHASNVRYLDCNHAGVLIVWDRLFGTFCEERADEPPVYGLTRNIGTYNPLRVAFGEYVALLRDAVRAGGWLAAWGYVLRAPGWSHDGPDKRSRTLRARLAAAARDMGESADSRG